MSVRASRLTRHRSADSIPPFAQRRGEQAHAWRSIGAGSIPAVYHGLPKFRHDWAADLEKRLRAAGLELNQPMLWDVRGPKTGLETARPARARARAPWTRWPDVRDVEIALIDAIAHVSWLRNSVGAHAGKKNLVRVLSACDVANAQHVARHLLLSSQGIFRIMFPAQPKIRKNS